MGCHVVLRPRQKIESIVRKGGTPDPDCPSCVQSIRYLCTKKKDVSEKEKVEQKGEAKIKVQATPGAMGTLLSLNSIPGKKGNATVAAAEAESALELLGKMKTESNLSRNLV